jgi:DNA polymerase I
MATAQNKLILNRSGCSGCPLDKADVCTPKMQPTIAQHTEVYFLAEAPGAHEDEQSGRPLTGPSGKLLRSCIPGVMEEFCSFDNCVRDRPPKNRTPVWQEIESCRGHVIKSIEEAKPALIIGLGAVPLGWMLQTSDLSAHRGRLYVVKVGNHICHFLPTYHPSFILRTAFNKDKPLNSKFGHCFRADIERGFKSLEEKLPKKVETEAEVRADVLMPTGAELVKLLQQAKKADVKAIDIETSALRPYAHDARILTIAISFEGVNFSFPVDHPKSMTSNAHVISAIFKELLADDTIKVAHNAPFEIEWFIHYFGRDAIRHDVWECTQMQAHMLDERRSGQSLDDLCRQHFGVAYKGFFKLDKKNMAKADLHETLVYNAVDTKYTLRLWHKQHRLLKEKGLTDAYYEALPRQATVALMQSVGILIDQAQVKICQRQLEGEINALSLKIAGQKVVQAFVKEKGAFNPASNPETVEIFRDYLKRPEVEVEKDGKSKFSVDKNVLEKIDHPLAKLIVEWRNRSKLKSTYVDCFEAGKGAFIWPDGLIHPSFNTTFTETGRTSSVGPNQQNWPQRNDRWVRKQVVAPKGHVIIAVDYGQLEACTSAICSRDKVLVKALWENYDIHREWTERLVARYPLFLAGGESLNDPKIMKRYRSIVKNKLVFPAIFGAQNESIAGYLRVPEDVIDDLMDDFWRTFHGLKAWQDKLMKRYYETGYVESPTGRRRYYPMTRNQAINDPIQSLACDIVCSAMNEMSRIALTEGPWHLHPIWNIHDDLGYYIPDSEDVIEASIDQINKVMLKAPYDFINVPLSTEVSIGTNWAEMIEIGRFWSHKDL